MQETSTLSSANLPHVPRPYRLHQFNFQIVFTKVEMPLQLLASLLLHLSLVWWMQSTTLRQLHPRKKIKRYYPEHSFDNVSTAHVAFTVDSQSWTPGHHSPGRTDYCCQDLVPQQ